MNNMAQSTDLIFGPMSEILVIDEAVTVDHVLKVLHAILDAMFLGYKVPVSPVERPSKPFMFSRTVDVKSVNIVPISPVERPSKPFMSIPKVDGKLVPIEVPLTQSYLFEVEESAERSPDLSPGNENVDLTITAIGQYLIASSDDEKRHKEERYPSAITFSISHRQPRGVTISAVCRFENVLDTYERIVTYLKNIWPSMRRLGNQVESPKGNPIGRANAGGKPRFRSDEAARIAVHKYGHDKNIVFHKWEKLARSVEGRNLTSPPESFRKLIKKPPIMTEEEVDTDFRSIFQE